jgi:small subunit ribosomal protein S9
MNADDQNVDAQEVDSNVPELTLGGSTEASSEQPVVQHNPVIRGRLDRFGIAMGTGRRKTSVARVRISAGDGKFEINGRTLEDYLPIESNRIQVVSPLKCVDKVGKVNIWVRVEGGGITGQTGAIILGIARALQIMNPDYHAKLAAEGLLTRDGRAVERKKYGLKKARRAFQFSKR